MKLLHQAYKQLIAGLKIPPVCSPLLVLGSLAVIRHALRQDLSTILYDHPQMRVNIIIILNVVLVV